MPVSRRGFLNAGGAATAAGIVGAAGREADAAQPSATVSIAKAKAMKVGVPVSFHYPNALSPALAI